VKLRLYAETIHQPPKLQVRQLIPGTLAWGDWEDVPLVIGQQTQSDDPCPGCRPWVVCRTPFCGRLIKKQNGGFA
jgi:hypothetical protein